MGGDGYWFFILRLVQNSLHLWLSNCHPLSKIITEDIMNIQMMFSQTKICILASVIVAIDALERSNTHCDDTWAPGCWRHGLGCYE